MSEIRRKLVIVGDGACGKVCAPLCSKMRSPDQYHRLSLSQTCLLIVFSKGTFPEVCPATVLLVQCRGLGGNPINHPANDHSMTVTDSLVSTRCTFPQCSRTTSPMSRSMESTLSSLYGIRQAKKTMTVSDPSATPTHTSSSSVSPLTLQIPLITFRRRCVFIPRVLFASLVAG